MFVLGFITGVLVSGICVWLLIRKPPNFLPW
jgi:hypothetical protein